MHGSIDMGLVRRCVDLSAAAHDMRPLKPEYTLRLDFGGDNTIYRPRFLAVSRDSDLYIIVRGSIDVADFTAGLEANPVAFLGDHRAHRGGLLSAEWLLEQCREIISSCAGHVVVSGHSFGGCVGSIAVAILRIREDNARASGVFFASTPSMSRPLSVRTRPYITTFVMGNDPIPKLSPQNLKAMTRLVVPLENTDPGPFGPIIHRFGVVALGPFRPGCFVEKDLEARAAGVAKNIMRDSVAAGETDLVSPGATWNIVFVDGAPQVRAFQEGQKLASWGQVIDDIGDHKFTHYLKVLEESGDALHGAQLPDCPDE